VSAGDGRVPGLDTDVEEEDDDNDSIKPTQKKSSAGLNDDDIAGRWRRTSSALNLSYPLFHTHAGIVGRAISIYCTALITSLFSPFGGLFPSLNLPGQLVVREN